MPSPTAPDEHPEFERTSFLYVRTLPAEKERWIQAAQLAKITLDDWVAIQLNKAASPLNKPHE
jgi:hypothetical protein